MDHKSFPRAVYEAQMAEQHALLGLLKKKKSRIAWVRLLLVGLIVVLAWYLSAFGTLYPVLSSLVLISLFIRLVVLATNNNEAIENSQRLFSINQQELTIAAGHYTHLPDGAAFLTPDHSYANDLDIFGRASLYQYLNRSQSEQGNAKFAGWLLAPADMESIVARQAAVKELAPLYQWRQQLQAYGMERPIAFATEKKVGSWMQQENTFSQNRFWTIARWLYPALTLSALVLFFTGILSNLWFIGIYILELVIANLTGKLVAPQYDNLDKVVPEIEGLYNSARWIESQTFQAARLKQVQGFFFQGDAPAAAAIKQLKNILGKFDASLNMAMTLLLNPLLLWNLQLVFTLEKWRADNKTNTLQWFNALAELEAMASVANCHFNHPNWAFPVFDAAQHGSFQAAHMGHPLIPEHKMVYNNFSTQGKAQVALITGSNMAGKSTFLRSTGVNIVLAMMGAPVCAAEMRLSPMRIISSMRVADNLEESTSTFYAELKKLKSVIDCINGHEKVFVLLDEILRGTNSLDRHTGSKALIRQLIQKEAVAMLATHDVELAQLQQEFPMSIHNYHFDAQIANEELYFDYKLKEGVCQSINASLLMRKIGIEL